MTQLTCRLVQLEVKREESGDLDVVVVVVVLIELCWLLEANCCVHLGETAVVLSAVLSTNTSGQINGNGHLRLLIFASSTFWTARKWN